VFKWERFLNVNLTPALTCRLRPPLSVWIVERKQREEVQKCLSASKYQQGLVHVREANDEGAALAFGAGHADLTAVNLHQPSDDCQPTA